MYTYLYIISGLIFLQSLDPLIGMSQIACDNKKSKITEGFAKLLYKLSCAVFGGLRLPKLRF